MYVTFKNLVNSWIFKIREALEINYFKSTISL